MALILPSFLTKPSGDRLSITWMFWSKCPLWRWVGWYNSVYILWAKRSDAKSLLWPMIDGGRWVCCFNSVRPELVFVHSLCGYSWTPVLWFWSSSLSYRHYRSQYIAFVTYLLQPCLSSSSACTLLSDCVYEYLTWQRYRLSRIPLSSHTKPDFLEGFSLFTRTSPRKLYENWISCERKNTLNGVLWFICSNRIPSVLWFSSKIAIATTVHNPTSQVNNDRHW